MSGRRGTDRLDHLRHLGPRCDAGPAGQGGCEIAVGMRAAHETGDAKRPGAHDFQRKRETRCGHPPSSRRSALPGADGRPSSDPERVLRRPVGARRAKLAIGGECRGRDRRNLDVDQRRLLAASAFAKRCGRVNHTSILRGYCWPPGFIRAARAQLSGTSSG